MEEWMASTYSNYGFGISLSASQEITASYNLTGAADSFYTKRFFARGTQYFFKNQSLRHAGTLVLKMIGLIFITVVP